MQVPARRHVDRAPLPRRELTGAPAREHAMITVARRNRSCAGIDEREEVSMEVARRMRSIPPYLFADLDRKRAALRAKGVDVISLGIGDPDLPTPAHIIDALAEAARNPITHTYPPYEGTAEFRRA